MKKLLTLAIILLAAFSLAACKPANEDSDPTVPVDPQNNGQRIDFGDSIVQKTKIVVWIDDEAGEYMQAVIAEFNKLYPNIIVEHQHYGSVDAREMLKTFGPSGNGADVFQFPHDHLAQAVLEDLVYPLPTATKTKLEARAHELGLNIATLFYDETNKSFNPASPNAVERLYAVPMSIESVGLFYNTDMITTPAATYEALFAAADVWNATADPGVFYLGTSSHWADSYFMQHVYSSFGFFPFGPTLDNPSAVGFETQAAVNALTWIRTQLKPRATGTGGHNSVSGGSLFEQGKIPYVIAGPWNHEAFKNAGINYAVAPLPSINGNPTRSFAGAMMAAVYKYSDFKEEAIAFVEFLNSDIAMELQYEYKGKLPALKAELLENIEGVNEDALLMAMAQQLTTSVPMPTIPQVTYYWGPGETLLQQVWNTTAVITEAVIAAESGYRTRANLAG
jgi:arabinogalactan oligomer / maltooligosaccharide transport system substrate-binding protein